MGNFGPRNFLPGVAEAAVDRVELLLEGLDGAGHQVAVQLDQGDAAGAAGRARRVVAVGHLVGLFLQRPSGLSFQSVVDGLEDAS